MPKSKTPKPSEFLTSVEAAQLAGVSRKAVLGWIKKGYLRARRKGVGPTSNVLIYRDSLEKLLRDREINTDLDE